MHWQAFEWLQMSLVLFAKRKIDKSSSLEIPLTCGVVFFERKFHEEKTKLSLFNLFARIFGDKTDVGKKNQGRSFLMP